MRRGFQASMEVGPALILAEEVARAKAWGGQTVWSFQEQHIIPSDP